MIRWLLWNVRCLRGRRCADLIANAISAPSDPVIRMEYVCEGCGTAYFWDSLTRERRRI